MDFLMPAVVCMIGIAGILAYLAKNFISNNKMQVFLVVVIFLVLLGGLIVVMNSDKIQVLTLTNTTIANITNSTETLYIAGSAQTPINAIFTILLVVLEFLIVITVLIWILDIINTTFGGGKNRKQSAFEY